MIAWLIEPFQWAAGLKYRRSVARSRRAAVSVGGVVIWVQLVPALME